MGNILSRLWKLSLRKHFVYAIIAIIFLIISAIISGVQVWIIQPIIDGIVQQESREELFFLGAILILILTGRGVASYIQALSINRLAAYVIYDLQAAMIDKILQSSITQILAKSTGEMTARFTFDVAKVRDLLLKAITSFARDLVMVIAMVGNMIYHDAMLAIIVLMMIPIAVYPIVWLSRKAHRLAHETQAQVGLVMARIMDSFRAIAEVKAERMENEEGKTLSGQIDRLTILNTQLSETRLRAEPVLEGLTGLGLALVLVIGGLTIHDSGMSLGAFVSFFASAIMAYQPLRALGKLPIALKEGQVALERIYQIIDQKEDNHSTSLSHQINQSDEDRNTSFPFKKISLEKVKFTHQETEYPILQDISFEINRGEIFGVSGVSGSGKSSLLLLIMGFLKAEQGKIIFDDHEISNIPIQHLHQNIGWVGQDFTIMDRSIKQNIALGLDQIDDDMLENAAKKAGVFDFIMSLPQGFNTELQEMGQALSGGQRQRLALARAYYHNHAILLLDEITSALDAENEQLIMENLRENSHNRIVIVVSHRAETLKYCDKVVILSHGQISLPI